MWTGEWGKRMRAIGEGFFHNSVYQALQGRCDDKEKKVDLLKREMEFLGDAIKYYHILGKEVSFKHYKNDNDRWISKIRERVSKALPEEIKGDFEKEAKYISKIRKSFRDVMHGKDVGNERMNEMLEIVHNMDKATLYEASPPYC